MSGIECSCLIDGYDGDNEFYVESWPVARKEHHCCECREVIPVGSLHQRTAGKSDGLVWSYRTCKPCADMRASFCCTWTFGHLCEDIRNALGFDPYTGEDVWVEVEP